MKYFLIVILYLSSGCQLLKRSDSKINDNSKDFKSDKPEVIKPQIIKPDEVKLSSDKNNVNQDKSDSQTNSVVLPQIVTPQGSGSLSLKKQLPKFGLIFSAGGAKTWAHLGVLKELQKFKFPISSVAGVEWGSIIAALYASNASVSEVEWELSKFKSQDQWLDFVKTIFEKKSTLNFKIPFVCPSLNLKNKVTYLLNRGFVDQFIPFCIPSPGLIKPYASSVAHMSDIGPLVQHLKATGVNKIIYINVIKTKSQSAVMKPTDSLENQVWTQAADLSYFKSALAKDYFIDEIIDIELTDYEINDFDARREIIEKGSEISYPAIRKLSEKYKL